MYWKNLFGPNLAKIILIISSFVYSVLLISSNTGSGLYESSIYDYFPPALWGLILFSILIGLFYCCSDLFSDTKVLGRRFFWGLSLVFLGYLALISLLVVRGYYVWSMGDPATHYRYILDLFNSGFLKDDLVYPSLHILSVIIMSLSGVDMYNTEKSMSFFLYLLFPLFIFTLSRRIYFNKNIQFFALILSFSFLAWYPFKFEFVPQFLGDVFLVITLLVIYCYVASNDNRWLIIAIFCLSNLVFMHPLCSIIVLLFIASTIIEYKHTKMRTGAKYYTFHIMDKINFGRVILCLFLVILIVQWYSLFSIWSLNIRNISDMLIQGIGISQGDKIGNLLNSGNAFGYNMVEEIVKLYFGNIVFICGALCIIFGLIFLQKLSMPQNFVRLIIVFFSTLLMIVILSKFEIGINLPRLLVYPSLFGLLIFSIVPRFLELPKTIPGIIQKAIIPVVLFGILVSLFILSIYSAYPSPFIYKQNLQITEYEMKGMDFMFIAGDEGYIQSSILMSPIRYGCRLLSTDEYNSRYLKSNPDYRNNPPYHFGYDQGTTLSDYYHNSAYLNIAKRDEVFYCDVFPKMAPYRYLTSDFLRLNSDHSVDKVYMNKEFTLWLIQNH